MGYEELAIQARRVVYGNGKTVEVNWGDEAVGDLAAMSFRIWEASQ